MMKHIDRIRSFAMIVTACLTLMISVSEARSQGWYRADSWENMMILDLECRSGQGCIAIVERISQGLVRSTTDGGRTWDDLFILDRNTDTPDVRLDLVQFASDSTLVTGAHHGAIGLSRDLGRTWAFTRVADTGYVEALHMRDSLHGVVAFGNHPFYELYATEDGGATWKAVPLPASVGVAGEEVPIPSKSLAILSAASLGKGHIVAVCNVIPHATLIRTTDHGTTWSEVPLPSENPYWVRFYDDQLGFLYGGRARYDIPGDEKPAIYRTTDGGQTWSLSLVGARVRDISFRNSREMLAVGELDKVYASSDGGQTWAKDSFHARGVATPWCALPDSTEGIVVSAFSDLYLPNSLSAVPLALERDGGIQVHLAGGADAARLVVENVNDNSRVEVRLYDIRGRSIATLAAETMGGSRHGVVLPHLTHGHGAYVAVVLVNGRESYAAQLVYR